MKVLLHVIITLLFSATLYASDQNRLSANEFSQFGTEHTFSLSQYWADSQHANNNSKIRVFSEIDQIVSVKLTSGSYTATKVVGANQVVEWTIPSLYVRHVQYSELREGGLILESTGFKVSSERPVDVWVLTQVNETEYWQQVPRRQQLLPYHNPTKTVVWHCNQDASDSPHTVLVATCGTDHSNIIISFEDVMSGASQTIHKTLDEGTTFHAPVPEFSTSGTIVSTYTISGDVNMSLKLVDPKCQTNTPPFEQLIPWRIAEGKVVSYNTLPTNLFSDLVIVDAFNSLENSEFLPQYKSEAGNKASVWTVPTQEIDDTVAEKIQSIAHAVKLQLRSGSNLFEVHDTLAYSDHSVVYVNETVSPERQRSFVVHTMFDEETRNSLNIFKYNNLTNRWDIHQDVVGSTPQFVVLEVDDSSTYKFLGAPHIIYDELGCAVNIVNDAKKGNGKEEPQFLPRSLDGGLKGVIREHNLTLSRVTLAPDAVNAQLDSSVFDLSENGVTWSVSARDQQDTAVFSFLAHDHLGNEFRVQDDFILEPCSTRDFTDYLFGTPYSFRSYGHSLNTVDTVSFIIRTNWADEMVLENVHLEGPSSVRYLGPETLVLTREFDTLYFEYTTTDAYSEDYTKLYASTECGKGILKNILLRTLTAILSVDKSIKLQTRRGEPETIDFVLKNTTDNPVRVDSIKLRNTLSKLTLDLSGLSLPFYVEPDSEIGIPLTYQPVLGHEYRDTIDVFNNGFRRVVSSNFWGYNPNVDVQPESANSTDISMLVVPNPANSLSVLQIDSPGPLHGTIKWVQLNGTVVFSQGISSQTSHEIPVPSSLRPGVYIAVLQTGAGIVSTQFVMLSE